MVNCDVGEDRRPRIARRRAPIIERDRGFVDKKCVEARKARRARVVDQAERLAADDERPVARGGERKGTPQPRLDCR
jgi:hypothetical protein